MFWQITLIWIQAAPHSLTKAFETRRFSASCTRLLFLLDLMACAIQLDFFVFAKVGDYFPCDSDTVKPEYLVWDASMDANFKQIELLTNQLYTISEMGSAVFGDLTNKAGDVPSGSALRRLMMSPLAKARRLANRFDTTLKKIISASAEILGTKIAPEEITITWHDGLPADPAEDAEIMSVRTGGKATLSQYTAIQRLDDMSAADTDAELAMIRSDDIDSSVGLEETALEPIEGI